MSTLETDELDVNGVPWSLAEVVLQQTTLLQNDATVEFALPASGYSMLKLEWWDVEVGTDGAFMGIQYSADGGSTWINTASYNPVGRWLTALNAGPANDIGAATLDTQGTIGLYGVANGGIGNHTVDVRMQGSLWIRDWQLTKYTIADIEDCFYERPTVAGADYYTGCYGGSIAVNDAQVHDRARILLDTGTFDAGGKFKLTGMKEFLT